MNTLTLYHATNVDIGQIGVEKQTMYFTGSYELAKTWGDEHYDDYDVLEVEIPVSDIYEYIPERPAFAVIDFEQLEVKPELITGKCVHFEDASDGYIVKNINDYELK
ncbi:MAG TPA: hypothetical protein VK982_00355 [Bacteroidales bacterium]|nr:hypothetical protein [Bacteroidales bacterium]